MNILLFAILFLMSILNAGAEPLRLKVTPVGNEQFISYDENDWYFVAKESNYNVYLAKGEVENKNGYFMIQSLTSYDGHEIYSYMEKPVKRVYTYGALDCANKQLYLLGSLYSAEDDTVQYLQYHEMGTWIADLVAEGTARNEVYKAICNTSI